MKWIWLGPVLVWATICLFISFYMIKKVHDNWEDILIFLFLGVELFFIPLWYPIIKIKEYFECRKIKIWHEEVKRKYEEINERKENKNKGG